jgi:dienelactone hydrolase
MKRIYLICTLLISLVSKSQTVAELSESFIKKLIRNHFDSCQSYFDTSVAEDINAEVMQSIWERIPQYVGEFKSYEDIRTEKADTLDVVFIRCVYEKTKLDLKTVYNNKKKIVGIFFIPPKSKTAYNLPDYYDASKQYENKLTVKTGTFEMPGILCMPNNIQNPPVVILIAGSGPNDKDETVGPNKPLKDIALGLASKGIASFRYDKRTKVYGTKLDLNKTGLYEEVVEDALNAIKLIRENPTTKESKIVIAGHSLGAMCAPWVASKSKDVVAVILLAGPGRPLEDLADEQMDYLLSDKFPAEKVKEKTIEYKKHTDLVRDPKKLKKAEANELPFGLSVYYWQSVKNYDEIKTAKKLKQPLLILQGERDYQVTMVDFNILKKELGTDPKNKFISYSNLNHLFQKGEGKSKPDEYNEPGNMEAKVIADMVEFVKSLR